MTTTTTTTTAVETAAATVAELEAQHRTAQQAAAQAQAYAAALPARLAAGDQSVTTDDLVQAGPAAAVAQAKVSAVAQQVSAARAALEDARAVELVARLRSGEPFLKQEQLDKELDRIAAYVVRELGKLGKRIEEHNASFYAVVDSLPRGASHVFTSGPDGDRLSIHHDHNGKTIELDGAEWWAMSKHGLGRDILGRVEMFEAQARDAAAEPAPRILTWGEILDQEQAAALPAA